MGSFNKIGFVSNLPIVYGDKATIIFMFNQYEFLRDMNINIDKLPSGSVNSNDFFEPMFLPIHGEYDDYGKIENIIETPIVKYIESYFGLTITEIVEQVDDNVVGRGDKYESPKNNDDFKYMTFCLELTEVYDDMVGMVNPNISTWGGETSTNMEVINSYTRGIRFNGTSKDLYNSFSRSTDIMFHKRMLDLMLKNPDSDTIDIENAKNEIEKLEKGDSIDLLGMTGVDEKSFMDFISFDIMVSTLNSKYFPSNYGNQDQNYLAHYELLSKYLNIITNKINNDIYENGSDFKEYDKLKSKIREEKIDIIFDPDYGE